MRHIFKLPPPMHLSLQVQVFFSVSRLLGKQNYAMDPPTLQCTCGKLFLQYSALNNHTRTCTRSNKEIGSALAKAKNAFNKQKDQKRQRQEELALPVTPSPTTSFQEQSIGLAVRFNLHRKYNTVPIRTICRMSTSRNMNLS